MNYGHMTDIHVYIISSNAIGYQRQVSGTILYRTSILFIKSESHYGGFAALCNSSILFHKISVQYNIG